MAIELSPRRRMASPLRELARMEGEIGGVFGRFFHLPGLEEEDVENGTLEVQLPKSRESKGRKIEIKAE